MHSTDDLSDLVAVLELIGKITPILEHDRVRLDAHGKRFSDLAVIVAELAVQVDGLRRDFESLAAGKHDTGTMYCARCGAMYGAEDGPPLCGPCWRELGKPDTYKLPNRPRRA